MEYRILNSWFHCLSLIFRVQEAIVDMRERRTERPSLIHRRGIIIDIEPVTLEVRFKFNIEQLN